MIPWLAGLVASYLGWFLLSGFGFFAGLMGSLVGLAVGGYYGAKWVRENVS